MIINRPTSAVRSLHADMMIDLSVRWLTVALVLALLASASLLRGEPWTLEHTVDTAPRIVPTLTSPASA